MDEQDPALFRTDVEGGVNRVNFDAWDDCLPASCREHQFGPPSKLAGFKQAIVGLRRAMLDLSTGACRIASRSGTSFGLLTR